MHDNDDYLEGLVDGILLFFNPKSPLGWLGYTALAVWAIYYFW
jgi:hypothetical protein